MPEGSLEKIESLLNKVFHEEPTPHGAVGILGGVSLSSTIKETMAESRIVVYGAIAGNIAVAATKFIVASITGSSAMLSEAIHSLVDTGDGLILLAGIHLSRRPPDRDHPFGYGKELYFWSLIVAVLIFGMGGGISFYEGVIHVLHPEPTRDPFWNYVVLAASAVFEGISFGIGLHTVFEKKGDRPLWRTLNTSKDPGVFTVVAEDSAALAGLALASLGIYFSHRFDMPMLDGAASIAIGLLLAGVATLLIYQSRSLLVGEGVGRETAETIRRLASEDPSVRRVACPLTMYFGPDNVLLAFDIEFRHGIAASDIVQAVMRIEQAIRSRYPFVRRIYIEAACLGSGKSP